MLWKLKTPQSCHHARYLAVERLYDPAAFRNGLIFSP
jgi:hypothetical protein